MDAPEKTIQKLAGSGIETVHDLVSKGARPFDRKNLASSTGLEPAVTYSLVKQADLQRVDGLESTAASMLVNAGIRTVADLAECNPENVHAQLLKTVPTGSETVVPATATIRKWKGVAGTLKPVITPDAADHAAPGLFDSGQPDTGSMRDEMFSDMVEMITNIGRGIAVAQQEMDEQAIRTQKLINADQRLRNMGVMATWFAIPDATFNLKMNYTVVREQGAEHDAPAGRQKLLLTPLNAKTQNYFKLTEGMQSELNIRFASMPPPPQVALPLTIPSLIGKGLDEAKSILADAGLRPGTITVSSGVPAEGQETEVTDQIPSPGSDARFQDRINLIIRRRTQPS